MYLAECCKDTNSAPTESQQKHQTINSTIQ